MNIGDCFLLEFLNYLPIVFERFPWSIRAVDHFPLSHWACEPLNQELCSDVSVKNTASPISSGYINIIGQVRKSSIRFEQFSGQVFIFKLKLSLFVLEMIRINCNYVLWGFESLLYDFLLPCVFHFKSIAFVFGVLSKALQVNRLVYEHNLTEDARDKKLRMVCKHDFLLDAAVMKRPSSYKFVRKIDLGQTCEFFDWGMIGLDYWLGHFLHMVREEVMVQW